MNDRHSITNTVIVILLIGCYYIMLSQYSVFAADVRDEVVDCSIINLIASPDLYHGKRVRVIGYAVLEVEHSAIYLSENDAKIGITMNGLWLSYSYGVGKKSNKYILVEGTFDKNMRGHLNAFPGGIKDVYRAIVWKQ